MESMADKRDAVMSVLLAADIPPVTILLTVGSNGVAILSMVFIKSDKYVGDIDSVVDSAAAVDTIESHTETAALTNTVVISSGS